MKSVFEGRPLSPPPLWLMRQAGRYLPEYQKIRSRFASFVDMCLQDEAVTTITLQPINRFDFDAAILFCDILLLPALMGQNLGFCPQKGPVFEALSLTKSDFGLCPQGFQETVQPVLRAISQIKGLLSPQKPLIGFAGSPWTVCAYMVEGGASKDFYRAKKFAFQHPKRFQELLRIVTQQTCWFLGQQIQSGVDVVQLFESWASLVPASHVDPWVLQPTRHITSFLRKNYPHVPLVGFAKGFGHHLDRYAKEVGFQGIGLDSGVCLKQTTQNPSFKGLVLQGNLDPGVLWAGGEVLVKEVARILGTLQNRPFIFNLGHGILPQTPLSHVHVLVDCVRSFKEVI